MLDTPWWKKPHPVSLLILAILCAWVPSVVLGIGTTPCFLIIGAVFVAILGDQIARRSKVPLRAEIIALALIAILSSIVSYWTSHPSTNRMFDLAFGIPPPAGLSNIEGRAQWFDGLTVVMHFNADDAAMQQLLAARKFEVDQTLEDRVKSGQFNLSYASHLSLKETVDRYWNCPVTGTSGRKWIYRNPSPYTSSSIDQVEMFRNEKGEVWVVYANGG